MWIHEAIGSEKLLSLFEEVPSFDDVYLLDACLQEDGPQLNLRINLRAYPKAPPDVWVANKYNTVQVKIKMFGLTSIKITRFSNLNYISFDCGKYEAGWGFNVLGHETLIEGVASWIYVDKVNGYLRDPAMSEDRRKP